MTTQTAQPLIDDLISKAGSREQLIETAREQVLRAVNYALDGQSSFRYVSKPAKTIVGIKVEEYFLKALNLPWENPGEVQAGNKLDTVIADHDVDVKFSLSGRWMIPPNAQNEWCLLFKTQHEKKEFSFGFLRMEEQFLTAKGNWDKKKGVNATGKHNIVWIADGVPLDR